MTLILSLITLLLAAMPTLAMDKRWTTPGFCATETANINRLLHPTQPFDAIAYCSELLGPITWIHTAHHRAPRTEPPGPQITQPPKSEITPAPAANSAELEELKKRDISFPTFLSIPMLVLDGLCSCIVTSPLPLRTSYIDR
ncbi:hypothetical protein HYFRA_00004482 [Hymenoscyphus fraxineus]|uniref:Uncharacterized protein n=1 Tax=Hymenoscyphus fraxineus TaxID=746836 RepID=A0A9N9KUL6_9HELO|nr:hypothetical protein HYFRA_00004482 [Hymenoscyphus fraxineus]